MSLNPRRINPISKGLWRVEGPVRFYFSANLTGIKTVAFCNVFGREGGVKCSGNIEIKKKILNPEE